MMRKFKLMAVATILIYLTMEVIFLKSYAIENKGNISGEYIHDNKAISNVSINLYKIAEFDENNSLHYIDKFQDYDKNIYEMQASDLADYATEISEYIKEKEIETSYTTTTTNSGRYSFSEIDKSIYLMVIEQKELDGYIYTSAPVIIAVPNFDELSDKYIYNITANIKSESKKIEESIPTGEQSDDKTTEKNDDKKSEDLNIDDEENNNNDSSKPHTYDGIIIYVYTIATAIILLFILVHYKIKKIRKGEDDNYED